MQRLGRKALAAAATVLMAAPVPAGPAAAASWKHETTPRKAAKPLPIERYVLRDGTLAVCVRATRQCEVTPPQGGRRIEPLGRIAGER